MGKLTLILSLSMAMLAVTVEAGQFIRFTRATIDPQDVRILSQAPRAQEMIVQFKTAIVEADKEALRERGFRVLGYLPDDALVVEGDFAKLESERQNPRVYAIAPYLPEFKINSEIRTLTAVSDRPELWLVTTFNTESLGALEKTVQENPQLRLISAAGKSAVVVAPRSKLMFLASQKGVEHVQLHPEYTFLHMRELDVDAPVRASENEPLNGSESGTSIVGFDEAWSRGFNGRGQIVSFADTGLDVGDTAKIHPDFAGAIKAGQIMGVFGKSWEDPMGHGTHVAGSIAGRGSFSGGALKGGAHGAMMVAQSMWSPMMNNIMPPSRLENLFNKAKQEGATVHSDSWGRPNSNGDYDAMAQQLDEWTFNNQDFVVLFAAGNDGKDANGDGRIDNGSIGSPASAKNCISVGASENVTKTGGIQKPVNQLRSAKDHWPAEPISSSYLSDNKDGIAMFSSRGPTKDGRIKPDIVAPGTNILSTRSRTSTAEVLWGAYNDHYVWSGGTSMATPIAAGAVTVARQYVTEKMGLANPSSALMKAVMMHTAVDMYPGQYGEVGAAKGQEILTHRPNVDEGYGRINVANVTNMGPATHLVDERKGVATGEEKKYSIPIGAGGTLLANLVYTDAAGSPNAAQALVNDLDLVLVKPDGSNVSANDHLNNSEIIELSNLPAGTYTLIVKGNKVPSGLNGAQPFALIWTVK